MSARAPETVFESFAQTAHLHGARAFLAVLEETAAIYDIVPGEITYEAALARVAALSAAYRAAGYVAGQRVGLLLENRPAFFLHWFALNALGISVVPINPDLRAAELDYLIGHSEIVAAVAVPPRHAALAAAARSAGRKLVLMEPDAAPLPPAVRGADDGRTGDRDRECALLYTSGTTGRPKGCVLPNDYFLRAGDWYAAVGGLISLRDGVERMITPLPLFHMNAMAYSAMAMIRTGGCLIALDRFHPKDWWDSVRRARATVAHYLGIMPAMLMAAEPSPDDRAHGLRFGFGAGVDHRLHGPFEARFGLPLIEAWAMTETGAGAVIAASHEPRHVGTGCFGRPAREIEVRVTAEDGRETPPDQPGELLVRHAGPDPRRGFFRDYLKDPAATAEAWAGGWFHTGDVVRRDPDGNLYFIDRRKNVIRRSGENISAVEVESVLLQHPAVRQVAVAAIPDALRGDEVVACVVVQEHGRDRASQATVAAEIVIWCLERLAYYKAPGYVAFVESLPLTATQKIQRGALKELVASVSGTEACIDTRVLKKRSA